MLPTCMEEVVGSLLLKSSGLVARGKETGPPGGSGGAGLVGLLGGESSAEASCHRAGDLAGLRSWDSQGQGYNSTVQNSVA